MAVEGRDSASAPSDTALAAFAAAGVRVYGGYIKLGNDGIYHGWSLSDFDRVRAHGMQPIAFVSGWDNPAVIRALVASWGVLAAVDVENGIRPDGSWVQPFLNATGFGLYGNYGVHFGRSAAFHVLSAYPTSGDPTGATWWTGTARPSGPCGWQWCGTHTEFAQPCDSASYDDWFTQGGDLTPQRETLLFQELAQTQNLIEKGTDSFPSIDGEPAYAGSVKLPTNADLLKAFQAFTPPDFSALIAALSAATQATQAAAVAMQAVAADVAAIKARVIKDLA